MLSLIKKLTKEDNFLSLAGNLSLAIFGFAGFALLARKYPVEEFGQWVLFISSASFVDMVRFGITNAAVIRSLSGAQANERLQLIGSNALICIAATILLATLILIVGFVFPDPIQKAGYGLFFSWYPALAFANLPLNTALTVLQADRRFAPMLQIKALTGGLFFLYILFDFLILDFSMTGLVWALILISTLSSAMSLIRNWDGLRRAGSADKRTTRQLLDFGRYTTFTLIGTNLLRNVDTLIISLSPLGTSAVALYSIPLKLTEIQQIPLRSFAATAFPKLSKASIQGKIGEARTLFYSYSGAITYLFIAVSLFTFVFAEWLVLLLGGSQYLGNDPVTGFNTTTIVRIFSVYGLLLPIDRMTGIGLDAVNRPDLNFLKVSIMVLANVIGDLVAVFLFKSLALVAVASILFTIIGVGIGYRYLHRELQLEQKAIFVEGIRFYQGLYKKFRNRAEG